MSLEVFLQQRLGAFELDIAFTTKGQVTALFGPSGAGKSSVVAAIAGLSKPRQGRIVVGERVVFEAGKTFISPEQRRIAVVFQDARLFPHMDVEANLRFGWRRAARKADAGTIEHVIALLGLEKILKRRPRGLSGGEKSRVALGRALLASPDMLLLDEPLAALDQARREEILPYLEKLARETKLPLLYVSHHSFGDHADVQLLCGSTRLVSRITEASRVRLKLEIGMKLYGVVKAVTVAREAA